MPVAVSSQAFFQSWEHSLSRDFAKDSVPAMWGSGMTGPYLFDSEDSNAAFSDQIRGIALSPDGKALVVASGDVLYVHDALTLERTRTLGGRTGDIDSVHFSPDGTRLITASSIRAGANRNRIDHVVRIWDVDEGSSSTPLETSPESLDAATSKATRAGLDSLTSDKSWSSEEAAAFRSQLKEVMKTAVCSCDTKVALERYRTLPGSLSSFNVSPFSHDSQKVFFRRSRKSQASPVPTRSQMKDEVVVLDVATRTELFALQGHTDSIMWFGESPDGSFIATSCWDETVRLWDATTGAQLHVLHGSPQQNWAGAFSPDSKIIAVGSGSQVVWMWDTKSGEVLRKVEGFPGWVRALQFSPDGTLLAAGSSGGTLKVVEVATGNLVQDWKINTAANPHARAFLEIAQVLWSSDGQKLLARLGGGRIMVYDFERNEKWDFEHDEGRIKEDYWDADATLSADGKMIWCVGRDGTVRRWSFDR